MDVLLGALLADDVDTRVVEEPVPEAIIDALGEAATQYGNVPNNFPGDFPQSRLMSEVLLMSDTARYGTKIRGREQTPLGRI
jgi:hypothetical protein